MTDLQPIPAKLANAERTPFSAVVPNLQVMWDSTSLGWLKRCPRYYQLRMLQGWETKTASIHLVFGILYHSSLEQYDKAKAHGKTHDEAQEIAVKYALENSIEHYTAWRCHNCQRVWDSSLGYEYCPACKDDKEAEDFTGWRDRLTGLSQKGREQLVRSVVWYTEEFQNDLLETVILANGEAAVELSFTLPLDFGPEGTDEDYALRGHLDRVAKNAEGMWVPDRKTTKNMLYEEFFEGFSPHNQVSLYSFAGKAVFHVPINGVIIDAAQLAVNFTRFARGFANRTDAQLQEWYNDLTMWLRMAETFAKNDHWPMNEESCNLYGGCPFRRICGKSPEVRDKYLSNLFIQQPWNPAEDR